MRKPSAMGVLSIAIALIVAAATVLGVLIFPSSHQGHPSESGRVTILGPYTLENGNSVALSFPICSVATVNWTLKAGTPVNFTVWPPALEQLSTCSGPPPSNAICLPGGCSPYGPNPVCFETGTSGSCSFAASQTAYGFGLWAHTLLPSGAILISPTNARVDFTVAYQ